MRWKRGSKRSGPFSRALDHRTDFNSIAFLLMTASRHRPLNIGKLSSLTCSVCLSTRQYTEDSDEQPPGIAMKSLRVLQVMESISEPLIKRMRSVPN